MTEAEMNDLMAEGSEGTLTEMIAAAAMRTGR